MEIQSKLSDYKEFKEIVSYLTKKEVRKNEN